MSSIGDKLRGANGGIGSKLNPSGTTYEQTQRVLNERYKNEADKAAKANAEELAKQQQVQKIAADLIKGAESRTVKADSLSDYAKKLSPERIQEIKETSAILNPEKYHKEVDLGYYGRRAVEGMGSAL